jgi:hypothetical protein
MLELSVTLLVATLHNLVRAWGTGGVRILPGHRQIACPLNLLDAPFPKFYALTAQHWEDRSKYDEAIHANQG